jgi:hypothetical protein
MIAYVDASVLATHDGALALGTQAHGLRVVGSPQA